jgi:hypothetical protein
MPLPSSQISSRPASMVSPIPVSTASRASTDSAPQFVIGSRHEAPVQRGDLMAPTGALGIEFVQHHAVRRAGAQFSVALIGYLGSCMGLVMRLRFDRAVILGMFCQAVLKESAASSILEKKGLSAQISENKIFKLGRLEVSKKVLFQQLEATSEGVSHFISNVYLSSILYKILTAEAAAAYPSMNGTDAMTAHLKTSWESSLEKHLAMYLTVQGLEFVTNVGMACAKARVADGYVRGDMPFGKMMATAFSNPISPRSAPKAFAEFWAGLITRMTTMGVGFLVASLVKAPMKKAGIDVVLHPANREAMTAGYSAMRTVQVPEKLFLRKQVEWVLNWLFSPKQAPDLESGAGNSGYQRYRRA